MRKLESLGLRRKPVLFTYGYPCDVALLEIRSRSISERNCICETRQAAQMTANQPSLLVLSLGVLQRRLSSFMNLVGFFQIQ